MKPLLSAILLGAALAAAPGDSRAQNAHAHVLDLSARDTTVSPCEDFFQYANGGWVSRTEIPAAYSRYGSFNELQDHNEEQLHALLEEAVRDVKASPATNQGRLAIFYGTCMDSAAAEAEGWKPLAPELAKIDHIATRAALAAEIASLHAEDVRALFGFGSVQDFKHSTAVIAIAAQGGLGLPDRDYYTKEDSASVAIRTRYLEHIARSLHLIDVPDDAAHAQATRIMAIETALAKASMTRVERRNPDAIYHKMKVTELETLAPEFDWAAYLAAVGVHVTELNVAQPGFMKALSAQLNDTSLDDWKTYLRWRLVDNSSPYLSSAFVNENFHFNQTLSGAKELLPRWKRCLRATDENLGDALGRAYVERHFPPAAKTRALEMVHDLRSTLRDRLGTLEWMTDSTRRQAIAKLDAYAEKIGYPDKWHSYATLSLTRGPFYANLSRANAFDFHRRLAKIGKPVDRTEWNLTTPTVNAYYNPLMNEIVFPAGILQPPFFDPNADDAVNYGGMGAVIGHEMTHGFDDQGRKFDLQGNLRDWWTEEDAKRYTARADQVVNQFNGYVAVDTVHVNGRLTLGENIADLGGLKIAWAALQKALARKPPPARIDGYTPQQRFFLSWAQVWREKARPERIRTNIATDPHSPALWRVDGPLSNMPEFQQAWGCKAGQAMVRPDSVRAAVW